MGCAAAPAPSVANQQRDEAQSGSESSLSLEAHEIVTSLRPVSSESCASLRRRSRRELNKSAGNWEGGPWAGGTRQCGTV